MTVKDTFFLLLSLFAISMSSCTQDESGEDTLTQGPEMVFDVSGETRASVTSSSDLTAVGSKFVVFGDLTSPENREDEPIVLFDGKVVENKGGIWSHEGIYYWFADREHSFVAIHPSSVCTSSNVAYSGSRLSLTYELPLVSGNRVIKENVSDILAATHRRHHKKDDTAAPVKFSFEHLLSLINVSPALDINIMDNDFYIEFHSLELSGFKTKAVFSVFPSNLQSNNLTDDREIDVTGQEGDGTLIYNFAEPVKVENNRGYVQLFNDNDALLMLPQTFDADSDAKVVLTYTVNGDSDRKQVSLKLQDGDWKIGKSYIYRFTIKREGPVFDSTVITDWDILNAGDFDAL